MHILGGLWGWLIAALAGLAGLLGYGVLMRKSGAAESRAETAEKTVATQQRMQRAEESGPRTRAEIIDELRRGGL